MARKILLAAITLVIILICYWFYVVSVELPQSPTASAPIAPGRIITTTQPAAAPAAVGSGLNEQVLADEGEKTYFERVSAKDRRLLYQFRTDHWRKIDQDIYELDRPELRLFMRDGQIIQISSVTGTITAKRVKNALEPQRGTLRGNVHVFIDRGTDPSRAVPELRQADVIHIWMDNVDFDLELSRVEAPGRIRIESEELDLLGMGLKITWDQATNRIQQLLLKRGEKLIIRRGAELVDFALPGSDVGESTSNRSRQDQGLLPQLLQPARGTDAQAPQPPASTQPVKSPATGPVTTASAPASAPTTQTTQPAAASYLLTFHDNIRIRQYEGPKIIGTLDCDDLSLLFDLRKRRKKTTPASQTQPTTAEAPAPPSPGPTRHLEVTWDGPLEMLPEPAQQTGKPRFHIIAVGRPVRVEQIGQGRALCEKLTVKQENRQVWLEGSVDQPVQILQEGRREIRCADKLLYDQRNRLAKGFGAGFMVDRGPRSEQQPVTTSLGLGDKESMRVLWQKGFEVQFDKYRYVTETGPRIKQYIKRASFTGQVRMERAGEYMLARTITLSFDPPGIGQKMGENLSTMHAEGRVKLVSGRQQIDCQQLDLTSEPRDPNGPIRRTAHARGDVQAREGERLIRARELIAHMQQQPEPATEPAAAAKSEKSKPRSPFGEMLIRQVEAYDNVRIRDPQLNLDCDALQARISPQRRLTWTRFESRSERWAVCTTKDFTISGPNVEMDLLNETADVPGPGRLDLTNFDQPASILWKQRMHMEGRDVNRGNFLGHVQVVSSDTTLYCHHLIVDFESAPEAETVPQPAEGKDRFWIFSKLIPRQQRNPTQIEVPVKRLEPVYMHAIPEQGRKVRIVNRVEQGGLIVSRTTIWGPELTVDLRTGTLNLPGRGNMLIEDYRSPKQTAAAQGGPQWNDPFGADIQSIGPSQTAFAWSNALTYLTEKRMAIFDGDVRMEHVAGMHLIADQAGRVQPPNQANKPKRRASLTCRNMVAQFRRGLGRGDRAIVQSGAADLQKVIATGNCLLQEGRRSAMCHRLVYDRAGNVVMIYGRGDEPASLFLEPTDKDPQGIWSGPVLIWHRDTGRVEAPRARIITTR